MHSVLALSITWEVVYTCAFRTSPFCEVYRVYRVYKVYEVYKVVLFCLSTITRNAVKVKI